VGGGGGGGGGVSGVVWGGAGAGYGAHEVAARGGVAIYVLNPEAGIGIWRRRYRVYFSLYSINPPQFVIKAENHFNR
jgi:hypothetical protein